MNFPRRKAGGLDQSHFISQNIATLVMKLDKCHIGDIVEKLKNEVLGLNLRFDGEMIIQKEKKDVEIYQIPPSSKFGSIQKMAEWATDVHRPIVKRQLGTLGYNDDTIIIALNHGVCDGKYIAGIANYIGDKQKDLHNNYFPVPFDDEFKEELEERKKSPPSYFSISPTHTRFDKYGMKKGDHEVLYDGIADVHSFKNYNPKSDKCSNLTASIVTGYCLSVSALQGEQNVFKLGGSMACNMRDVLREKKHNPNVITMNHTNFYTVVPMGCHVTPYTRLGECYRLLNKDLKDKFKMNQPLFDYRDSLDHPLARPLIDPGLMICFSHLGPIYLRKPLKDVYLYNVALHGIFSTAIPLLTYTIHDEERKRNEFHSQVRYVSNGLTEKQVITLSKSLKHFLQIADTNYTIGEIYHDLQAYQNSL